MLNSMQRHLAVLLRDRENSIRRERDERIRWEVKEYANTLLRVTVVTRDLKELLAAW